MFIYLSIYLFIDCPRFTTKYFIQSSWFNTERGCIAIQIFIIVERTKKRRNVDCIEFTLVNSFVLITRISNEGYKNKR